MLSCVQTKSMATIQTILFPVDFSPSCVAMAPFVKRAAAIFSAKITLLYVLQPAASGFELLVRPLPEVEENRAAVAKAKLNAFLESAQAQALRALPRAVAKAKLNAFHESAFPDDSRFLAEGDAATEIVAFAREHRFDLIVMPTHAGVFRRRLLGSTTAKVLDSANCPVLTTQHAETIAPRPLGHRELVCAIGSREDAERVLRYVTEISGSVSSHVTIVHAIPASELGLAVQLDLDERVQHAEREAARQWIEEMQSKVGSRAPVTIAIGPIKDALVEAARRLQADALVIGRSPQVGAFDRLRDLTYAVVRDAPCPVLSV